MFNNHLDRSYPGGRKTKRRSGFFHAPIMSVVAIAAILAISDSTESHAQPAGGTGDGVFEALGRTTSVDCVNINTAVRNWILTLSPGNRPDFDFEGDYLLVNACNGEGSFCREVFAICLSSLENSPQIDLRSPDRPNDDLLAIDTELNGVYTGSDTVADSSADNPNELVQIVKTTFEDPDGATGRQTLPGNRVAVDRDPGQTVTVRIKPENGIVPLNHNDAGCPSGQNKAKVLVTHDSGVTNAITVETTNIFGSVRPSLILRSARLYDLDQATKKGFVVLALFDGFVVVCVDPEELVQADVDDVLRLEAEIGVNTPGKKSGGDTWSGWPQF